MNKNLYAINVRYIYSACIVTETPDITVLHDPWFTDGIYDGSWFTFPKVQDPLEKIGDCDYIFISHIHPDHYDYRFLRSYFELYGPKPVLIADHHPNHLERKMKSDGIEPLVLRETLVVGSTSIYIMPHVTGSRSDIDSAIVVKYQDRGNRIHSVVNANDIVFDTEMMEGLKKIAGEIDILLCGYTGAGPYPQTYFQLDDPRLPKAASEKKQAFFERYKTLIGFMRAKVNIPFAGTYLLGGHLAGLNHFRGVADAVEVTEFDSNAVVLGDEGGEIDTLRLTPTGRRDRCYSNESISARIDEINSLAMDYERLISRDEVSQLPLKRLFSKASRNAVKMSEWEADYYFCFKIPSNEYIVINANKNGDGSFLVMSKEYLPRPRSEIYTDPRYLFGLLTTIYHWNNAQIGSQYQTRRFPDKFDRRIQAFLNFLTI